MQQQQCQNVIRIQLVTDMLPGDIIMYTQGTSLKEHKFEWIGTKFQLADTLTKSGTP